MVRRRSSKVDIFRVISSAVQLYASNLENGRLFTSLSALQLWHSLLPADKDHTGLYRVYGPIISDEIYESVTKKKRYVICPNDECKSKKSGAVEYDESQDGVREVPYQERIDNYMVLPESLMPRELKTWTCPTCEQTFDAETYKGEPVISPEIFVPPLPNILKVLPMWPLKKNYKDLGAGENYKWDMQTYLLQYANELAAATTQYRADNLASGTVDEIDSDFLEAV